MGSNFHCPREFPAKTERALALRASRTPIPRGNSLLEGPTHAFSFKWLFFSYSGLVWFQTYLWILKDWSWSQLHWFYPGMIFGSVALVFGAGLVIAAICFKAYSEAAIAFGFFLWLVANYWWMIGELWGYQITTDSPSFFVPKVFEEEEYLGADLFYEAHQEDTQIISLVATLWLGLCSYVFPLFYMDRDSAFVRKVTDRQPTYHCKFWFRDFLEFENAHLFFWSMKDCFWAWDNQVGYMIAFALTLILMLDTVHFLATTTGQWVDLFHYISLLLWVIANGFWAYGELFIEGPYSDDFPGFAYSDYRFVPPDLEFYKYLWGRNVAGWIFFLAVLLLVTFYIHWLCFSKVSKPGYEHVDAEKSVELQKLNAPKDEMPAEKAEELPMPAKDAGYETEEEVANESETLKNFETVHLEPIKLQ